MSLQLHDIITLPADLPADVMHLFYFLQKPPPPQKKPRSKPILFHTDRKKLFRKFQRRRVLRFSIVSSSTPWFNFSSEKKFSAHTHTRPPPSLSCAPVFSLLFQYLLGEMGPDESLQTQPCIHTCAPLRHVHIYCRTPMIDGPANSATNRKKYLRKTTDNYISLD